MDSLKIVFIISDSKLIQSQRHMKQKDTFFFLIFWRVRTVIRTYVLYSTVLLSVRMFFVWDQEALQRIDLYVFSSVRGAQSQSYFRAFERSSVWAFERSRWIPRLKFRIRIRILKETKFTILLLSLEVLLINTALLKW